MHCFVFLFAFLFYFYCAFSVIILCLFQYRLGVLLATLVEDQEDGSGKKEEGRRRHRNPEEGDREEEEEEEEEGVEGNHRDRPSVLGGGKRRRGGGGGQSSTGIVLPFCGSGARRPDARGYVPRQHCRRCFEHRPTTHTSSFVFFAFCTALEGALFEMAATEQNMGHYHSAIALLKQALDKGTETVDERTREEYLGTNNTWCC